MIIRSFTIDGFGIFADQTVTGLPDGVSIFLGNNEAGKSTCLKFFRHILFGFPTQNHKDFCPALRGGNPGGSLMLETRAHEQLRLERRPGVRGGPYSLLDPNGERLDPARLETLLGGVTRDVYESVYGFSLSELQDLRSLSGEKVRHALYGASFGTATKPVGQVLKRLDDALNSIYKSSGQNPPLNKKLAELDDILRQIRDCENAVTAYEQTLTARKTHSADLDSLLTEKNQLLAARNELERRLSLWEQMQRLQSLRVQLASISPAIDNFPVDGLSRLEHIRATLADRSTEYATAQARLKQLETQQRTLGMERHLAVLAQQSSIVSLAEEKGRYRTLIDQRRDAEGQLIQLQSHIQRIFEELGADWNAGRVRGFDRSVFTRERIEQFSLSMSEASAEVDKAREQHESRTRELADATVQLQAAESDVARLGNGPAGYDPALVDQLAARREHVQRLLDELPRKEQAYAITSRDVDADIAALVPDWKREHIRTLDTSFTARGSIAALGRALSDTEQALHDAQVIHKTAEAQLLPLDERIRQRQAELNRFSTVVTKEMVDTRRNALRALRTTLRDLTEARQRLEGLQQPGHNSGAGGSTALLGGSAAAAIAGATLLTLSFGILPLPEAWQPLSRFLPYGGYILLGVALAGAAMFALRKRTALSGGVEGTEARLVLAEADVDDLYEQAQAIAVQAGADTLDESGIDRAEIAIDLMREDAEARDRILRFITEMQQERDRLVRQVQEASRAIDTARNERDLARQNWGVHARDLLLPATATPDMAMSILDRVEGIRARLHALETAAQEMAAMRETVDAYLDLARRISTGPESGQDTPDIPQTELLEAVTRVLEDVRRSRDSDQERARAAQALHERKAMHVRCDEALRTGTDRLAAADETLRSVRTAWQTWLADRGLAPTLSTATALAALQNITDCVARLDAHDALQARISTLQHELGRFAERQDGLLASAGQGLEIPVAPDGTVDRMAAVDSLSQALAAARDAHAEHLALGRELASLSESLQALGIQKQQYERERLELLDQGGTPPGLSGESDIAAAEEQFRQRGQAFARRQAVMQELVPLEASLASLNRDEVNTEQSASGGEAAPADIQLTEADRSALEVRLNQLVTRLNEMEAHENSLRQQISDGNATLKGLASADTVAELRLREAGVREDIRVLSRDWARHALARQMIVEAKRTFERERQPAVIQNASDFFSIITGGSYSGLHTSLDDDSIRALLTTGESRIPEQLSRGTQEQLFLALRLGFILSHSAQREPLPVIMDDILVNFDPGRAAHTAAALADLSQHNQILFFTCHPRTAETMRTAVPDASVFTVQNGTIRAAETL